jgi:PAS domain S-box-containing protein
MKTGAGAYSRICPMTNPAIYSLICEAFAASSVGLAIRAAEGRTLYTNPALENIFGRSQAELEKVRLANLYHPEDQERSRTLYREMLAGNTSSYRNKMRILRPNGQTVWVLNELSVLRDAQGRIVYTVSLFHDISASHAAEAEAAHNTALLQVTLATMATAFGVYSEDMRLLHYNAMFEKLFDFPEGFLYPGIPVLELHRFRARRGDYGPGNADELAENRFAEASRPAERSSEHKLATGKSYIHHRKSLPGGGCVTTYMETTEQRAAEDRLRHAQKMEAVGQLTGGVAHDFNNLLAVMLGNLELLRDHVTAGSDARQIIDTIYGAGQRGARLTQQLPSFSRKQTLNPRPMDVSAHVRSLIGLLRRTLGESIEIVFVPGENVPPSRIDESQFDAALINLCINSRDAMPHGGQLTIITGCVKFDEAQAEGVEEIAPGEYTTLGVFDTGSGMTPEVLQHATEPFFTTKDTGQGSGLGLSMVYGFARQSGGFIRIESTPGLGTSVTLYLPTAPDHAVGQAKEAAGTQVLATGRTPLVLVVEDDPEVRAVAVAMISRLGCRTTEAVSAKDALDQLDAGAKPDLLFTDIVLPGGMNGIELARAARARYPALRILLTSGYPDVAARDSEVGLGEILLKPYTIRALEARLRAAFND